MNTDLIYIYNPDQAIQMIKQLKGNYIHRIGKGNKGDILITFIKNDITLKTLKEWQLNN